MNAPAIKILINGYPVLVFETVIDFLIHFGMSGAVRCIPAPGAVVSMQAANESHVIIRNETMPAAEDFGGDE